MNFVKDAKKTLAPFLFDRFYALIFIIFGTITTFNKTVR